MRHVTVLLAGVLLACILPGCGKPYYLHSNLSDAEIRSRLDANVTPGMTREQIETKLDELRVTSRYRKFYPARVDPPRDAVLLVRLWEPGGLWIDSDMEWHHWVDAMFIFDANGGMSRIETVRTEEEFFQGQPVHSFSSPELPPNEPPLPERKTTN